MSNLQQLPPGREAGDFPPGSTVLAQDKHFLFPLLVLQPFGNHVWLGHLSGCPYPSDAEVSRVVPLSLEQVILIAF